MPLVAHSTDTRHLDGRDIVVCETKPVVPSRSEIETMAKQRFQDPKPKLRGNWWTLRIYRDEFVSGKRVRVRVRENIAPKTVPYREVQKIAAEILRPLNQGLVTLGSATGFANYVNEIYIPTNLPLMAASTRQRYEGILKNYIMPTFGHMLLRDLTSLRIQQYLSGLCKSNLSHESKDKIRDVISSVLGSAKRMVF